MKNGSHWLIAMKAAVAGLLLVCSSGFLSAQGSVTFQNNGDIFNDPVGTTQDRRAYWIDLNHAGYPVGGGPVVGTNYAAQLWYDFGTGFNPVPDAIRLFRLPTTTLPGTWNTSPTPTVILPGVGVGQAVYLQVRVWDIQKFESYNAALVGGGEGGASELFSYVVPAPGSAASDFTMKGLRAWTMFRVVPEPSTVALVGSAVLLVGGHPIASRSRRKLNRQAGRDSSGER